MQSTAKPQALYTDGSSKGLQLVLVHQNYVTSALCIQLHTNKILCTSNSTRPTESTEDDGYLSTNACSANDMNGMAINSVHGYYSLT